MLDTVDESSKTHWCLWCLVDRSAAAGDESAAVGPAHTVSVLLPSRIRRTPEQLLLFDVNTDSLSTTTVITATGITLLTLRASYTLKSFVQYGYRLKLTDPVQFL